MASSRERTYGGQPAQERRDQRRQRLIEAGLDVIGDVGISGLTMTLVARQAELTERYFYESFADRDELLVAVFTFFADMLERQLVVTVLAAKGGMEARARATATALVSALTDDRRQARLFAEAVGSEVLRPYRAAVIGRYVAYHVADLIAHYALDGKAIRDLLNVSCRMLVGGLAEALVAWLDGSGAESPDVIIDACVQLTMANARALVVEAKRRAGGARGR
jgi:AcrR family transcriptional regulator